MRLIRLCATIAMLMFGIALVRANAADEKPVPTVTIYGLAHLSLDYTDNGKDSSLYLESNSSRIGFKGGMKLNETADIIYQVESLVNMSKSGDVFATRNTYLGVKCSTYGQLWAGKYDTPFKQAGGATDFFIDRIGDYRNIAGNSGKFDLRASNILLYQTPSCAGLNATVAYAAEDGTNYADLASANICYKTDSLQLMGAYEIHGKAITGTAASSSYEVSNSIDPTTDQNKVVTVTTPATLSAENESGLRFSASYKLDIITLIGLYEKLFDVGGVQGADRETYGGGLNLDLSHGYTLRAECLRTGGTDGKDGTDATEYAGGVDKKVTDNLTIYVDYALMDNGSASSLTCVNVGHGDKVSPAAAGDNVQSESLGVIYKF